MVFVVVDELVPEAHARENSASSSWASLGVMLGFVVMMSLDVAL